MSAIKSIGTFKALAAGVAVVVGLSLSTGQLTAATVTSASPAAGDYTSMVHQPSITETAIFADGRPDVFARARAARDAFGFPTGSKRTGRHVHDGYRNADYDEVSELDASGKALALTQFDGSGGLVAAVRFDGPSLQLGRSTSEVAIKSAQRGLTAYGMRVGGEARPVENTVTGGWDIQWDRVESGIAVRGDQTRVHVWHDGRIQSAAKVEHQLAAAPERRMGQTEARQSVDRQMGAWFAGRQAGYSVDAMELQWVGPNAAFDIGKLNSATGPYRLAWVANVKPSGAAADYVTLITLFVDAGDGSIIGGDVVE